MEENNNQKNENVINLNNPPKIDLSKKKNENSNKNKDDNSKKEVLHKKEKAEEEAPDENNSNPKDNMNLGKRHRRGKCEISDRLYKCPECDKSYLSGPALTNHRRIKHKMVTESEKKSRGRPKKEIQQENSASVIQNKFSDFFNIDRRKLIFQETNNSDNFINLNIIKGNMKKIFEHGKSKGLFSELENFEEYSFYKLITKNWEKENPEIDKECYCNNKGQNLNNSEKFESPPLDDLFFLYLKECSKKTNKEYFWFINKFIVLFREFINQDRKEIVKEEYKTEEKKEYTQLYCAEGIPESCNDFFLDFMEPRDFFGLDNNELIELTQHFSFWLYSNKYSHSYLILA